MAKFAEDFLDRIREALPVSAVASRSFELIKKGHEYVVKQDPSVSINDQKRIWHDFGKADKGGDIFGFVMHFEGCDFVEAVKRCAEQAGIPIEGEYSPASAGGAGQAGRGRPAGHSADGARSTEGASKQKPVIKETYDYVDASGRLIYQVVRFEPKNFSQRRPYLEEPNVWVWGLDEGEYMRFGPGKDWRRFNEKTFNERGYKQRKFIGNGAVHGLYNLPAVLDAVDEDEVIFLPEGEKDCHTFERWDFTATTNSGGAKHWTEAHVEQLVGADVVVPIDNDDAGRDRGHKIAASLSGKAKRVRVLDLAQHWSDMPAKADITDWRDKGGTREMLEDIVSKLPTWSPAPPRSSFGAVRFVDLDLPAREHEWLIKGVLPRYDLSILAGEPGSGKSFEAIDFGFGVARAALDPDFLYMGRKVRGGLVLYQAGEGGTGVKMRMRAYRQYHGIPADMNLPFVLMPHELNLFSGDEAVKKFIEEAKMWSSFYEMPVELVPIDTFSAATTGANENMAEDMTKALNRGKQIADALGCHVMLVHHWNKAGSLRGWSGLKGNVETVIEVEMLDQFETQDGVERQVRVSRISKQKDGVSGLNWKWTLPSITIGRDKDGDPVTSCIVRPLGEVDAPVVQSVRGGGGRNVGVALNDMRVGIFRSLLEALDDYGEAPPASLQLPASVAKVVKLGYHYSVYTKRVVPNPEDIKKNEKTLRSRLKSFREFGQNAGIVGISRVGGAESADAYIWPTGKPVFGRGLQWPPQAVREAEEREEERDDVEATFWD